MRRPVLPLTAALVLLTASLVLYRIFWLGYPLWPVAEGKIWQLLVKAQLTPRLENAVLALGLPAERTGYMVIEERIQSGGGSFSTAKEGPNRLGLWSWEDFEGLDEITYRAVIHFRPRLGAAVRSPLPGAYPPAVSREELRLAERLAADWQALAPEGRFQAVLSLLKGSREGLPVNDAAFRQWLSVQKRLDRADAALTLLRAADLPARPVEGLRLAEGVQTRPAQWIEVWTGRSWVNLDPEKGEFFPAPAELLPLAVGGVPAVGVSGVELADIRWTLNRQVVSQWKILYDRVSRSANFLDRWSLLQLPPEFQGTFRVLLLVPMGALIISFLRNVIGLSTFGIFMPMLIALAFRSTGLLYGVGIFCAVLLVGFAARSSLEKLHLLVVPRLSVILTLVIACFTLLALLGNRLGLREFMAVGLIPFVILTLTIERFFIIIEESGVRQALVTAGGSVAVSAVTYGIISWEPLQMTFFVYPELILTVAALQILLGRYTGYRVSELFRFRSLGGSP